MFKLKTKKAKMKKSKPDPVCFADRFGERVRNLEGRGGGGGEGRLRTQVIWKAWWQGLLKMGRYKDMENGCER